MVAGLCVMCVGWAAAASGLRYGAEAFRGCALGGAVAALAGVAGWWVLAREFGRGVAGVAGAVGGAMWVRLRMTVVSATVIALWLKDGNVWFLGWTCVFYVLVLVCETAAALGIWKRPGGPRTGAGSDVRKLWTAGSDIPA